MGENGFDFWQDHSIQFLEMAFRTDRREIIKNPDGYGKRTGVCGDTVQLFLTIRDNRIQSISFDTDGCMNTNACCNTLVHLAEGKTIEEAWKITPEAIVNYLETLPLENTHCAELTAGALYLALANYHEVKKSPWKKLYRGV
jgi:nitrogen fixation protein NifU and related proteins